MNTAEQFARLCAGFDEKRQQLRIPGAAIAVHHQGDSFAAGFGVTSVEQPLAVHADTLFQIGSITKTFVAALVMRLVEQGRLDLDLPVRTYVPGFAVRDEQTSRGVTLRHTLTHTAGWLGDWFNDHGEGDDAITRMVDDMRGLPQWYPLGKHWSYNNVAYALAARAIETVTGLTFERAMQQEVFDPLGLSHTFYFPGDVMTHRFAVGHNVTPDAQLVARPWPLGRSSNPPGGITSTVNELLRYAGAHWRGDGWLSAASLRELQRAHRPSTGLWHQGLSWWLNTFSDGTQTIDHGGATNGQIAQLTVAPARRFAVAVLTNAGAGRQLTAFAVNEAARNFLNTQMPDTPLRDVSRETMADACGDYEAHLSTLRLFMDGGRLMLATRALGRFPRFDSPPPPPPLDAPPPVEIGFYDTDRFVVRADTVTGARGELVRDDAGRVAWVRWGARMHRRLQGMA